MSTPDYSGLVFAAACGTPFIPAGVQFVRRRRDQRIANVQRRNRADAQRETELVRMVGQRDRYYLLYHEAVKRNAVLLGLAELPTEDVPTPLFDRACLAWLDKSTEWDAS